LRILFSLLIGPAFLGLGGFPISTATDLSPTGAMIVILSSLLVGVAAAWEYLARHGRAG